jgi:hypothetical protein
MAPDMFETEAEWLAEMRRRLVELESGSDDMSVLASRLRESMDRVAGSAQTLQAANTAARALVKSVSNRDDLSLQALERRAEEILTQASELRKLATRLTAKGQAFRTRIEAAEEPTPRRRRNDG